MYCKWYIFADSRVTDTVLIVAKCIVNFFTSEAGDQLKEVLIVAKCIVNKTVIKSNKYIFQVLIVAKCIVN